VAAPGELVRSSRSAPPVIRCQAPAYIAAKQGVWQSVELLIRRRKGAATNRSPLGLYGLEAFHTTEDRIERSELG